MWVIYFTELIWGTFDNLSVNKIDTVFSYVTELVFSEFGNSVLVKSDTMCWIFY